MKICKTCKTCKYWKKHEQKDDIGLCHRYPPHIPVGDSPVEYHPNTRDNDWCGEFVAE